MNQAPTSAISSPNNPETVQTLFAMRLTAALTAHQLETTSPDIEARLSFARERAMACARKAHRMAVPSVIGPVGGAAVLAGGPNADTTRWWLRLGSLIPLAILLAGLALIDNRYTRSQIDAAVDVDAAILADDLPPEAYSDRGFVEFLRTARP